jgi:hypothetical protein
MVRLIQGEVYEPVETGPYTLEYDIYMQALMIELGISEIMGTAKAAELTEADKEAIGLAILRRVAESGQAHRLLAGFIKSKGAPWSAQWATLAAERINKPGGPHDERLKAQMILEGLARFFHAGPRSPKTSRWSFARGRRALSFGNQTVGRMFGVRHSSGSGTV